MKPKRGYTVIRHRLDEPLDDLVETLDTNLKLNGKIEVSERSISIPTKLLKDAIKTDDVARAALNHNSFEFTDIVPPRAMVLGSYRIADSMGGREYLNAVMKGDKTAYFDQSKSVESAKERLKTMARYIPAALVGSMICGVLWMGVQLARNSARMMENYSDQNRRSYDSTPTGKHADGTPDGLSQVLNERSGYTQKEEQRSATQPADKNKKAANQR